MTRSTAITHQLPERGQYGVIPFFRKVRTALGIPIALLLIVFVRLLTPILRIRFGVLVSQRIGHFAANTEIYVCEREAGLHGKRTVDLFCYSTIICNQQLKKMWERVLPIHQWVNPMTRVNGWVPGWKANTIPVGNGRDTKGLLALSPPHLSFAEEEEAAGKAAIQAMGIPEGATIIAFHTRDSAYLKQALPHVDWSGHDIRDAAISNYLPAMERLTRLGYYCLRMGAVIQEPLEQDNPMIIDYAAQHRSDFLDIYIAAKCRFFLGSQSGLEQVSNMVFRRPIVYVNWVTLEVVNSWGPGDLTILKHLVNEKDGRNLGFREMMESGVGRLEHKSDFEQRGIVAIENTPQEIADVVLELEQRLNGTWKPEAGDDELQERFWSLVAPSNLQGVIRSRIGAKFLRENQRLLD